MKYRIRKTDEIVDVVGYSACTHTRYPSTDYVCYIDSGGTEIIGRGLNLIWDFDPINEENANDFDWQSFRTEAAKDFTIYMLDKMEVNRYPSACHEAIRLADELIKQLKEKEEK